MKNILLLLFVTLFSLSVVGKKVIESDAVKVANNFYFLKCTQNNVALKYSEITPGNIIPYGTENNPDFYVITYQSGGFVIVCGIDELYPIIGYSITHDFGLESQAEHYKSFLQGYADQIEFVMENGYSATNKTIEAWNYLLSDNFTTHAMNSSKDYLAPIVPCKWDQGYPYNVLCPEDEDGPGGYVYAGCVATAMAQVMYYWRYPLQGIGSHSYYAYPYGTQTANFGATEYKWDVMGNHANHSNPYPIAELQYHCGVGVEMHYSPNGSGAYSSDVPAVLRDHYGYSDDVFYNHKNNYEHTEWIELLKENLNNGWPMYYSGYSTSGGHAFVCDGYEDEFFHFNFGWGGSSDGYYSLYDVNSFNQGQGCVFNTYPGSGYPYYCSGDKTFISQSGTIEDGSGPVDNYLDLADCLWLISPQTAEDSISGITLKFSRFDVAVGDNLIIYNGSTTDADVLATLSGSEIPEPISTSGNQMLIQFLTDDASEANGWLATFTSTVPDYCQNVTEITVEEGSFSDGSGTFTYHNSTVCMWAILPDSAEQVTLSFTKFDTEAGSDVVKIFDYETQQQLAEFSGQYAPESMPQPVTSYSGKMFVTFSSNHINTFDGWVANYHINEVGINDQNIDNLNISIYPNPVEDLIYIDLETKIEGAIVIQVQNLNGQILSSHHFGEISNDQTLEISTSDLSSGLYIVSLKSNDHNIHRKILKK